MICLSTVSHRYSKRASLTFTTDVEAHLSSFIRWALRVTSSGEYSGDLAIELLEQAWSAQKLLWQLRKPQIGDCPVENQKSLVGNRHLQ